MSGLHLYEDSPNSSSSSGSGGGLQQSREHQDPLLHLHFLTQMTPSESEIQLKKMINVCNLVMNICKNIIDNPCEEKYRRIRVKDPCPTPLIEMRELIQISSSATSATNATCNTNNLKTQQYQVLISFFQRLGFTFAPGDDFARLPPTADLRILDVPCVAALDLKEQAASILSEAQARREEAVMRQRDAEQEAERERNALVIQFSSQFRAERQLMRNLVNDVVEKIDSALAQDSASAFSLTGWTRTHESVERFFELLSTAMRKGLVLLHPLASSASSSSSSALPAVQEELDIPKVPNTSILNDLIHFLFSSSFEQQNSSSPKTKTTESFFDAASTLRSLISKDSGLNFKLIPSSSNNKQQGNEEGEVLASLQLKIETISSSNQESSPTSKIAADSRRVLAFLLDSISDAFASSRHVKAEQFEEEHSAFRHKLADADSKRITAHRAEALSNSPKIDLELLHTATSLISEISAFQELCWKLEGSVGYERHWIKEAEKFRDDFTAGKIKVADLHAHKRVWQNKYEKLKKEKAVSFSLDHRE